MIAYSLKTGEPLAKYKLGAAPAFDGMAATAGKLYLSTKDGTVVCFAGKES